MLKYIYTLFVFCILFFSACKKDKLPLLTVTEEKLIEVLVDIHIAEAALQPVYEADKDSLADLYYDQIFEIHDFDRESFFKNMAILRKHPELTRDIYKKVTEKIKVMDEDFKAKK